jgi:hypothetical protein
MEPETLADPVAESASASGSRTHDYLYGKALVWSFRLPGRSLFSTRPLAPPAPPGDALQPRLLSCKSMSNARRSLEGSAFQGRALERG